MNRRLPINCKLIYWSHIDPKQFKKCFKKNVEILHVASHHGWPISLLLYAGFFPTKFSVLSTFFACFWPLCSDIESKQPSGGAHNTHGNSGGVGITFVLKK